MSEVITTPVEANELVVTNNESDVTNGPISNAGANDANANEEVSDFQKWAAAEERGQQNASQEEASKEDASEATGEAPEAPKEETNTKVWKLKVNGKEIEFDASNEEKVKAEVQKAFAAQEKFQHAAKVQKQAETFLEMLQRDPETVLSHPSLGVNLREFAENYLYKQLQEERLSPEEKQARTEKQELERYRAEREEQKKVQEAEKMEQLKEQYRQDYQQKFISALEKTGIPKTDWSIKRMADYMREAIKRGHTNITPEDVAPMVKQDWLAAQRELLSSLDGEQLIEMVGRDTAEKIRKHQVSQASKANPFKSDSSSKSPNKEGNKNKKVIKSLYEFMES